MTNPVGGVGLRLGLLARTRTGDLETERERLLDLERRPRPCDKDLLLERDLLGLLERDLLGLRERDLLLGDRDLDLDLDLRL